MDEAFELSGSLEWLIGEGSALYPETCTHEPREVLAGFGDRELSLTAVGGGGEIWQWQSQARLAEGTVEFDSPADWGDFQGGINLFFRVPDGPWHCFITEARSDGENSWLRVDLPDTVYYLQRRRYRRVAAPHGTRAIFRIGNSFMESAHVLDISVGGMLISSSKPPGEYPLDGVLDEIFITVPPAVDGMGLAKRVILPLIRKGRVVRSCFPPGSSLSCYGVSFCTDSPYVREKLGGFVEQLEKGGP